MPTESGYFPARNILSSSDYYSRRAFALAGLTNPKTTGWWFDDFTVSPALTGTAPGGWARGIVAGGDTVFNHNARGGSVQLKTSATASSIGTIFADAPLILGSGGTERWAVTLKFAFQTTPDANTITLLGLLNTAQTKTIGIGFDGALDATNLILQYDGLVGGSKLSLATMASIGTSEHVVEMVSIGDGKIHVYLDEGADLGPVTQSAAPTDPLGGWGTCRNGVTAANQAINWDFIGVAFQRS